MLVVHAVCAAAGTVRLWAEDSERRGAGLTGTGARRYHPFAALPADLTQLGTRAARATEPLALLLPGLAGLPLASPDLAAESGAGAGLPPDMGAVAGFDAAAAPRAEVPELTSWLVDTVGADAGWVPPVPSGALRLGASAAFFLDVAAFAVDLAGRGRVLPAAASPDAGPVARWRPVLSGPDAGRFDALSARLPPVFRAASAQAAVAGARLAWADAAAVLTAALDGLVDAQVRGRLAAPVTIAEPGLSPLGRAAAAWLDALSGTGSFTAPAAGARALAARVEPWRAGGGWASPLRVCFRLAEPGPLTRTTPGDEEAWRVDFLLQAVDEPGVQVPADQVWARRPAGPSTWPTDAEEALLAGLGRAVAVWPGLGPALREARPTGLDLDLDETRTFLGLAAALEQEGFGVLVPSWWTRPVRPTSRLTVRAVNPVPPILRDVAADLDRIVDFRWAVSLGETELTRAELDSLARAKAELVRFRGRWTRVDPAALARIDPARQNAGQTTVRDVLGHTGLWPGLDSGLADSESPGAGPAGARAPVEIVADGWLGELLAGPAGGRLPAVEAPAGLGVRLRPYQAQGLAWLALLDRLGVGGILADDMGLGKTIQLLALELLTRDGVARGPTLVVCPTSVVGNWLREAEQVAPALRVYAHHAHRRRRDVTLAEACAGQDLVVTTYTQLTRDVGEFREVRWERLVVDEAQQIKNAATAQARAVRQVSARHRLALTGTPVENRLADLWAIMSVVAPGLLGSAASFRARYAVPVERYRDPDAADRLRRRIRPVVLRRVKTDPAVLRDLPAKVELRQLCTLTTEQAALYRAVVDDMMERLRDASSPVRRNGVVLAAMTKLKQVCNHPAHLLGDGSALPGRSGKLARLEDLLTQIVADGERALCFTQFARFGAMLMPYLRDRLGVDVSFLHGGLRAAERDDLIERFQTGPGPGVFLLSLKAGGTGVNLTAARHVVHVDRWWNPAVEAQATDRAHRLGQRGEVWVHTLLCMGTLEERIDRILTDKAALARTVVGGGESWLSALSTDQLRDLVALAPEAVDD